MSRSERRWRRVIHVGLVVAAAAAMVWGALTEVSQRPDVRPTSCHTAADQPLPPGGLAELHLSPAYIAQVPAAKRRARGFRIGDPVRGSSS